MKKFLLLSLLMVACAASAWAVTDGVKYEPVNGIGIKNLWIQDRAHTPEVWSAQPYCNTYARTAVMHDGFIYIAHSNAKTIIEGTDTLTQSVIYKLDATNGQLVKELDLTLDGEVYGGAVLSCNTVGVDNFGHLYMSPYTDVNTAKHPVYLVDKETGELTLVGEFEKDLLLRCDYIDVMGDLTREQAECNIMTVSASDSYIYRWHADEGGDFEYGYDDVPFLFIMDYFPLSVTNWGYAPVIKMVPSWEGDYSGELFYIDGFYSAPILYDLYGSIKGTFEGVDSVAQPMDVGANGVCEFSLEGRSFIVYVAAQYTGTDASTGINKACQVYICELGEDMEMSGMKRYWMVPDELGTISDSGTRVQSMNVEYGTDAEGNEEVTLFIYKNYNGMAVYKIGTNVMGDDPGPDNTGDVNGDGEITVADVNALIEIVLTDGSSPRADVNGDGEINVADVNALISIILR